MAKSGTVVVDVRAGATLRACLDVVDLALECVDAMPVAEARREELRARAETLGEFILKELCPNG